VVWPINVYGRTKLEAEKYTSDLSSDALVIRTNFFGRSVRNEKTLLDWIIRSLEQGQPLIGFTDVLFSPVNIRVLSDAILHLLQKNASGVINVSCNEVISKHRFMVMVAETFNFPSELVREGRSSDLETMTKRPLNLSLDNQKLRQLINWPLPSLQDMIREVARARSH
jgi:dTDP-4-dehydrorhamnose reductase